MKKTVIAIGFLTLAIIGFALYFTYRGREVDKEQLHTVHIAAIHVAAEGKVEAMPGFEVEIGSELNGRIERFFVNEGDTVKKGDLIASLENRDLKAKLRESETEVTVARARLNEVVSGSRTEEIRKAKAALEGAVADLHLASTEFERYERLYNQGMISETELEARKGSHKVALSHVKEAEEEKALLEKGPKDETVRLNEDLIKTAEARVDTFRKLLEKTLIKSPISGKVIRKYLEEGEMVGDESILVAVADLETVRVNAEVDETDVGRIREGDPAEVTSDAYIGTVFKGEIKEISDYVGIRNIRPNDPAKNLDVKVVQVKIGLMDKTPLKLGMTVDVRIIPRESK
jgi:ABC exporter DevB family membrane fusion protein